MEMDLQGVDLQGVDLLAGSSGAPRAPSGSAGVIVSRSCECPVGSFGISGHPACSLSNGPRGDGLVGNGLAEQVEKDVLHFAVSGTYLGVEVGSDVGVARRRASSTENSGRQRYHDHDEAQCAEQQATRVPCWRPAAPSGSAGVCVSGTTWRPAGPPGSAAGAFGRPAAPSASAGVCDEHLPAPRELLRDQRAQREDFRSPFMSRARSTFVGVFGMLSLSIFEVYLNIWNVGFVLIGALRAPRGLLRDQRAPREDYRSSFMSQVRYTFGGFRCVFADHIWRVSEYLGSLICSH